MLCLSRIPALAIAGALFTTMLFAQVGTETLPDQDIGRPPRPPFISMLGILNPGKVLNDASLPLVGPVSKTVEEELRPRETPAGPAGGVDTSITSIWDERGRVIEEIDTDGSESDTINRYEGTRRVSEESTFPKSKEPARKFWNYWVYDKAGKLIEYRRGSGDELQNHDTNFKRDAQGRLISYEYRQGAKDELFSRTELHYSADGRTVDTTVYDATGAEFHSDTQTVDDRGRVIRAAFRDRDSRTMLMTAPVKVTFSYDAKGRLIEQDTSAREFEEPSEGEIPPGKISIAYDDVKRTKTTSYSGPEASMSLTATLNEAGLTTEYVNGPGDMSLDMVIHCTDDSHGNWTACQLISRKGSVDRIQRMWRRTITYR